MTKKRANKMRSGKYRYKHYILTCHGYYQPDKCIWWEAVNTQTNEADFHAHTKKELIEMISEENK